MVEVVPGFQDFMLPALKALVVGGPRHWREMRDDVVRDLQIAESDPPEILANGRTLVDDRMLWTMTHLFQAGLVDRVAKATYSLTERGREVLSSDPTRVDMRYLARFPEYVAFRNGSKSQAEGVREELADDGGGSGVELDETGTERIIEPFDPDEIDVVTRTPSLGLLMSRVERNSIDLQPDFQRSAGIWRPDRQSRLIESLLLRIPLPTFYVAEVPEDRWAVIDGVQRLTAITNFLRPGLAFGPPLRLTGLEYLKQYEGRTYDELPGFLQTRIEESEVVVHVVRAGTPDDVKFNIFARLNTGGVPLTAQEIRHALVGGPSRAFLERLASSEAFLRATGGSVSPKRMVDRELALRFAAFRLNEPMNYRSEDFDDFLRRAMAQLNAMTDQGLLDLEQDFTRAMERASAVFGDEAFRKPVLEGRRGLNPVNKALFEIQSVCLAEVSKSAWAKVSQDVDSFRAAVYERLGRDENFYRAISVGTGSVSSVHTRFVAMRELVGEAVS